MSRVTLIGGHNQPPEQFTTIREECDAPLFYRTINVTDRRFQHGAWTETERYRFTGQEENGTRLYRYDGLVQSEYAFWLSLR